jgi:hypothetical protein
VKRLAIALGAASLLVAAPSARAEDPPAPETQAPTNPALAPTGHTNRLKSMWRFELGYRGSFVREATFDPFSTQDYFAQVSLGGSRTVYTRGRFSFAPGFMWDYGKTGATSRGDAASLEVHRLVIPLEGRLHFGAWGYAFLRTAPGIAEMSAEVDDPASPANLTKSRWLFATDVSAGYAYPLWPRDNPMDLTPRIWLQADSGYGWITPIGLNLAPDLPSSDPRIASGVDLGSLTMRGAFLRVAAAISY